ncbi:MAG: EAL domain-containing protein [Deltaproteobacteria bacterium]|nr:EAL domain-containing protein [Deltaproteobacteria bacterium]
MIGEAEKNTPPAADSSRTDLIGFRFLPLLVFVAFSITWIYFTDALVALVVSDSRIVADLQTAKGMIYIAGCSLFLYWLLRRHQRSEAEAQGRASLYASDARHARTERDRLFDLSQDLLAVATKDGWLIQANQAWTDTLGWSKKELLSTHALDTTHPDDQEQLKRFFAEAQAGKEHFSWQDRTLTKDGGYRWIAWSARMVPETGIVYLVGRDITAAREQQEQIQHHSEAVERLNRSFRVIHECNGILVEPTSEPEMLQAMCKILNELGGYRLAMIAMPEQDAKKTVRIAAFAGLDSSFIESLNLSWGEGERGNSPSGIALRTGERVVSRDIATDNFMTPWRDAALSREIRSIIALPLKTAGKTVGVLSISATKPDAFDKDEIELLEELAGDIAYGIHARRMATSRQRDEDELRLAAGVMETSLDAILIVREDGRIRTVNWSFCGLTGHAADEVTGKSMESLLVLNETGFRQQKEAVARRGAWQGECEIRKRDGSRIPCQLRLTAVSAGGGKIAAYVASLQDVTPLKLAEGDLMKSSQYDRLTGLPNRLKFLGDLDAIIRSVRLRRETVGVAVIDVDRFGSINELFGHEAGDGLLQEIGRRLADNLKQGSWAARLGDDEFGILIAGAANVTEVTAEVQRLHSRLSQPYLLDDRQVFLNVSMGISTHPGGGETAAELLLNAGIALKHVREEGGNHFLLFQNHWKQQSRTRFDIETRIRHAVERGELVLHYQPVVNIETGRISGLEALARWTNPDLGPVSPSDFIPVAEQNGTILSICEWSMETACRQIVEWKQAGLRPPPVAINLTARQFHERDLLRWITDLLESYKLGGSHLAFELTEGSVMRQVSYAMAVLRAIKALGSPVYIDDFGTGYSSFSYLTRLSIDALKIDASFIRNLHRNADDQTVVRSMILMAHNLGLKVVAEGVETPEQADWLRNEKCDRIQGFLYSPAVDGNSIARMLQNGNLTGSAAIQPPIKGTEKSL